MPVAVEEKPITVIPEKTRTALSRMAGGAPLIAMRDGVAIFDQQVDVSGEKRNLELAFRQLDFRTSTATETVDATTGKKTRTVDLVWTTGASVQRYDWWNDEIYEESLEVTDAAIRMGRMNDGASLLNSHDSSDLASVLGKVLNSRIEAGQGVATVQFSNRESVDEVWQDVRDGIISKVSVGYRVYAWNIIQKEGEMTTKTATDWEPFEVSLVAIPADSGCSVRSAEGSPAPAKKEARVADHVETAPAAGAPNNETGADTRAAPAYTDGVDIMRYAANPNTGVSIEDADKAIASRMTFGDFVRTNVDKIATRAEGTAVDSRRTSASVTGQRSLREEMELRAEMFSAEMLERSAIKFEAPSDKAREYAGDGARGAAISFLRSVGEPVNERMSDAALIQLALQRSVGGGLTSSDFLAIYQKPAQAAIDQGWKDTLPKTVWQDLAGQMPLPDFDGRLVFSQSLFQGIKKISEDGDLPLATMSGNSFTADVQSSGIKIILTAQAQIRDNVGIWIEGVRDLGITWNYYAEALFFDTLENGYVNSSDGKKKIFSTGQGGNIIPITAMDEDNLEKLVLALRAQRQSAKLGGTAIYTTPEYLMVSPDLQRAATKALGKGVQANTGADVPTYSGLQLIVVNQFAPKTVYLTGQNGMKGMIKRAFLQGNGDPVIERLAMMSSLKTEWESYQHSHFVGASTLGAVKGQLPA